MRRTRVLTTLAFTLAIGLVGCSQGDDPGVASLDDDPSAAAASDDVPEDLEDQAKKFDECMTEHGVDMDDMGGGFVAGPGGGARTEQRSSADGDGGPEEMDPVEADKFNKAMQECEKYMPTPELSAEEEAELREDALAYVECVRDKGYDMPDPKIEGGGMAMELDEDSGIDPEDPAFREADDECLEEHMDSMGGPQVAEERS